MDTWGFEDLGIISDFEEEEEANESCPGNWMKPTMPASHRDGDRPHPPWEGHRDKLVGIVDMGRQIPIPDDVIADVVILFNRFLIVCHDMGVDKQNIHIVATEATRKALNSAQFIEVVKEKTGLSIEMLPKEIEGQIGALGIASGFTNLSGLVMDLGGGSTQITWMVSQGGHIRISPLGSFSFPYGAAALSRQLRDLRKGKKKEEGEKAVAQLRQEMVQKFRDAYDHLQIPETMIEKAKEQGGFRIYLSGGGFRGWGYLLLYLNQSHGKHYPISVINGYTVGKEQFEDTDTVTQIAKAAKDVFRVSDRRRSQVPAVAFLVNLLAEAIPHGIREAHFCQGGVREGYLFRTLSPEVRELSPLSVATQNFAPTSYRTIQELLKSAIPKPSKNQARRFPEEFGEHVIDSFANVMYVHMFMSKETASAAALCSTSVGIMSSAHGVSHQDRARLALMLESRYRGELPPREMEFREALRSLITPEEVWWATYLGRVGYMITRLYPSGEIDTAKPRVVFSAEWSWTMGKKRNKEGLVLTLSVQKLKNDPAHLKKALEDNVKVIQKVGKKKRWIGKDDPWGMKVKVDVVEEGILGTPDC
ncbi:hypothetical protein THAR02_02785 [Trichoderma harzianum]|uniref:Uncharacterized protein n=1 Tax=Trichoderma harzianum TaxID=5544 RepID=A0A0F9XJV4_TRIHA|nr:hypothetical protein THAR02_02785 [Trichoderma harzianum]